VTPLRQRMLEDLQIRHYSPTTIRLYLYAVRAFAKHFGKPPDQLGAEHIRRYQLFLTKEKKVSTSTYVMMICGLRFFYTHTLHRKVAIERIPFPRRERKLPLILSRDEVKALSSGRMGTRWGNAYALAIRIGGRLSESPATSIMRGWESHRRQKCIYRGDKFPTWRFAPSSWCAPSTILRVSPVPCTRLSPRLTPKCP